MSKNPKGNASDYESPEEIARQREQDVIVVPKGQSKIKSILVYAVMIFVLFIFTVGGAFQDTFSCSGEANAVHLSWKGVDGEPRALDGPTFYAKKQEYSRLRDLYPLLGMPEMDVNEDMDVARMIVMADIARGAGVRITDSDLSLTILGIFDSAENYSSMDLDPTGRFRMGWIHRQRALTTKGFEKTLRDVLVVQRFSRLLALGTGSVDHEELVTRWQATRTEYSFDYVEAHTSDFEPEVQTELPDTQALNAWLLALPAGKQGKFHSPERWSAEFAVLTVPADEGAGELLLAAYPRPEDEVAASKARDYFNSFMGSRFRRPEKTEPQEGAAAGEEGESEQETPGEDEASEEEETTEEPESVPDTPFFSYDEVEALCLIEAPLYYSLADWHLAVQARVASGEEVDLSAECEQLGLSFVSDETARSLVDWNEREEEWASSNLGNSLRFTQAGRYAASLHVHPGGIVAARVSERFPPALPEFPEIEVEVAAAWIKDAAVTRAKFTLEGIRDRVGQRTSGEPFEPMTTPEQFATASSNAGGHAQKDFSVQHRAFQERYVLPKPGEKLSAFEEFLRFNPQLFQEEDGRLWESKPSRGSESVFLVLVGPTRPADVSKMQPQDLALQRSQMASDSIRSFFATTFDFESPESIRFLEDNFDYFLQGEEEDKGSSGG